MNMAQVLDHFNISNKALGDYINEDGLLYCSRCHAPKQAHGVGPMDGKLLFITCDCQKREQAAEEKRKLRDKAEELRKSCVVLVRGEPVDQIALRDHVLVLQRQGAELSEPNPLADRVAVVAGELHDVGHVDHVRVGGQFAFVVTRVLFGSLGSGG